MKDLEHIYYNGCSSQKLQFYKEMTAKTVQMRQNLNKIFPCVEIKSSIKDGQMQVSEVIYNEKFLNEVGHGIDTFPTTIFQEGLPRYLIFKSRSINQFYLDLSLLKATVVL